MNHFSSNSNKVFKFSEQNTERIKTILSKYPIERRKSALMPLLDLAQRQNNNWISTDVIDEVSQILSITKREVYEIATFYTMYNTKPVGKYLIQVCTTTPCMLRQSEEIVLAISNHLKISLGETTPDGMFTLMEVECLGACSNAPVVQINDQYHEDLTPKSIVEILCGLK